jgi:hypothetical protein
VHISHWRASERAIETKTSDNYKRERERERERALYQPKLNLSSPQCILTCSNRTVTFAVWQVATFYLFPLSSAGAGPVTDRLSKDDLNRTIALTTHANRYGFLPTIIRCRQNT